MQCLFLSKRLKDRSYECGAKVGEGATSGVIDIARRRGVVTMGTPAGLFPR